MGWGRDCATVLEELLKRVVGAVGDAVDGACRELGGIRCTAGSVLQYSARSGRL